MKRSILCLVAMSCVAVAIALKAAPTPTPTPPPIHVPGKKKKSPSPTPPPIHVPGKKVTPTPTPPPIHVPGKKKTTTPTPIPLKIPGKATPTPTVGPIKIPGKATPTPTVGPIKIPGKATPTPTAGPIKIPGKSTPTPAPKILIPGKLHPGDKVKGKDKGNSHDWIDVDVYPPPPSQLGPPVIITTIPVYHAVPSSEIHLVPGGIAPVPQDYVAPPSDAPPESNATALRAWNGQETEQQRAFDQTRVTVAAAADGTASWQFYWKTTGPAAQAARWEIATVPFVGGYTVFPPAGLVGYGDASVDADSPLTENFFAVDFASFAKNFDQDAVPNKYYMRVVPVDLDGNPVGTPSNFVRIDVPK